jgi:hypothetical protein
MHDRFHKRSFVTFNNHLLDAMGFHLSEAETKSSPLKAVAEVPKKMYTCDLWAQMSFDYFFSAVLLRSIAPQSLSIRSYPPVAAIGDSEVPASAVDRRCTDPCFHRQASSLHVRCNLHPEHPRQQPHVCE